MRFKRFRTPAIRILTFFIAIILCISPFHTFAFAADAVTIISPGNAANWVLGTTQSIVWNNPGVNLGNAVKIELLKDGAPAEAIADSAPAGSGGTGSYEWTPPSDLAAGGGYQIRISSVDYPGIGAVSGAFTLALESAVQSENVTALGSISLLSAPVTGDGYSFDPDTGALTVSTDSGTTNWRSDAGIVKTNVKTVVIQSGVLNILNNAFDGCTALTAATLPSGLITIGEYAFYSCTSLQTVNIPKGVTNIMYGAFRRCGSLTAITIPGSVSALGSMAFYMCTNLLSVTFQRAAAPTIGATAFSNYAGFKIYYPLGGVGYTSLGYPCEAISMTLDIVTGDGYTFDPNNCTLTVTSDNGTSNWRYDAYFSNKSVLRAVVIQTGVQNILDNAFAGCTALNSVTLPSGLSVIKNYAFDGCTALGAITIPNGVSRLGYSAFNGCTSLKNIIVPSSVTNVDARAFYGCSQFLSATFKGKTAPTFGSSPFTGCAAGFKILYPIGGTGYTGLGYTAEAIDVILETEGYSFDTASGTLTIASNDGTTNWRNSGIDKAAVKSVVIQSGVTYILDNAFKDCTSLTDVSIPDGVAHIGKYAFNMCTSLTHIALPDLLISIGDEAFFNCTKLETINIPDGVTAIGIEALANTAISSISIPSSVQTLGQGVFCYCSRLKSVTFKAGCQLTVIPVFAFTDSGLASIDIPDSITSIATAAFSRCLSLTSVVIPGSVSSIDKNAFNDCSMLYAASFEGMSAPALGAGVFDGCHASFKIYYPVGGTGYNSLGYPAENGKAPVMGDGYYFDTDSGTLTISSDSGMMNWRSDSGIAKNSVKSIVIQNVLSSIKNGAFEGCTSLKDVIIPNSVGSIGNYAFRNCTSLTSVTIPENVVSIGAGAFYGCNQLAYAVFKLVAAPALGVAAFDGCHASFKIYYPANGTGYDNLGYPAEAIGVYALTVVNGTGSGKYEVGAQVSIKADAAPDGKVFNCWTANNGGTFTDAKSAATNFIMPAAAVTVTATFRDEAKFIIVANASGGGKISPAGTLSVTEGQSQTFAIAPNAGYRIASVFADGVSQGAISSYTFTNVAANHTITAAFTKIKSSGNVSHNGNGDDDSSIDEDGDTPTASATGGIPTTAPSAAPTPSAATSPSAQATGTAVVLKPLSVEHNDKTGLFVIVIDLSMLPEGTAAIKLNDGGVINIDANSGTLRCEISETDIAEDGTIEFIALDEEGVPLGNFKVQVKDTGKAAIDITDLGAGIVTTLLWIIGALFVAGAAAAVTVILIRRKKA